MTLYIVVSEEMDELDDPAQTAIPLQQAFAQVCCRAGYLYHIEQEQSGWRLVVTDGERPECSPEPITSTYVKRADAHRDLMVQAVDGRLKGFAAVPLESLQRQKALIAERYAAE